MRSSEPVSIHARWGARDGIRCRTAGLGHVSIHARWGARDWHDWRCVAMPRSFNSRALGSARPPRSSTSLARRRFNSRALGSARRLTLVLNAPESLVSIHARWGARDSQPLSPPAWRPVSIHARWGARDSKRASGLPRPLRFNSRALGSARLPTSSLRTGAKMFQFTRAGERATLGRIDQRASELLFQFTRAGERATTGTWCISRRASFQFTRAGERATVERENRLRRARVSIHARWGARDRVGRSVIPCNESFNSRALGSARPSGDSRRGAAGRFQFTRAGERATAPARSGTAWSAFQFTRAGERATRLLKKRPPPPKFQFTRAGERATRRHRRPRSPQLFQFTRAGERATQAAFAGWSADTFQFTRAGERATLKGCWSASNARCFNSRALGSARRTARTCPCGRCCFNSRALGSARPEGVRVTDAASRFQFTRAGERATGGVCVRGVGGGVSIHARWGARD